MQHESWKQPAHHASEAVLLPALDQQSTVLSRLTLSAAATDSSFRPAMDAWENHQKASSSSPQRPQGSIAGRSVLRAAAARSACRRRRYNAFYRLYPHTNR